MATATKGRGSKKAARPPRQFFAEARIGRSGLLVDALEDILPACRGSYTTAGVFVEIGGGAVHLEGRTNLELQATRRLEAPHDGTGRVAVNAEELAKALRTLRHEPVSVTVTQDGVTILGSARITLPDIDGEAIPGPQNVTRDLGSAAIPELLGAIERVSHASATEESRPVLCTIAIRVRPGEEALVMATDSYRGAVVAVPWSGYEGKGETLLVPREAAAYLLRRFKRWQGTVSVTGDESWARFTLEERWTRAQATVAVRLIEGEFPDLLGLFPSEPAPGVLTVGDVRSLAELAAAAGELTDGSRRPIGIGLGPEGVMIQATAEGGTEVEMRLPGASYSGEPMEVAFNGRYLSDLARFASGLPILRIGVREAVNTVRAGVLGEDGFAYLLAPVRLPAPGPASEATEPSEADQ